MNASRRMKNFTAIGGGNDAGRGKPGKELRAAFFYRLKQEGDYEIYSDMPKRDGKH